MSKIFGIGTDIETIDRFIGIDKKTNGNFLNKIYTKKELDYCFSKENSAQHLAARYASKEAVIKALNSAGFKGLDYKEIEILNDKNGIPHVNMKNKRFSRFCIHISLSHCADKAIAFAVVLEEK